MSKIWRYGDHVDTDVIIPARYLNISDPAELATHAMEDIDTTFAPNVKPGEIVVAGVKCVIADSYARIFYRNAINIGLPALELGADVEKISKGDDVEVHLATGEIKIVNKGITLRCKPLPEFTQKIAAAGGLIEYVRASVG